ncbi:MAG: hypothetical protein K9L59_07890 [Desulfobacterales bacterium]|nr:hypothetical protein [Desulfobacterales bacterium]MCF8079653.1 hypothetical protein [Desulfobacterales bacterium]
MKMTEVRQMAKELGVQSFGKSKVRLVREIQKKQGHFDCFATVEDFCDQSDCLFRRACFEESKKRKKQ